MKSGSAIDGAPRGTALARFRGRIEGIVQGVGFRPFVHGLATRLGLSGWVRNDPRGVDLEVEGARAALEEFRRRVVAEPPPLAVVASARWEEIEPLGESSGFAILQSASGDRTAWISPDVAVCDDCLREMRDPSDRRYRYPFINCTNCGPRYTILVEIPYDRDRTTMRVFRMCERCRAEYEDPRDRRFHAQPISCWDCGPRLALLDSSGRALDAEDPVREAARLLVEGRILALRGLGGFHLACDARNEDAVRTLRRRKSREEKPFAVMVGSVAEARYIAEISEAEESLLTSRERPIVLLKKLRGEERLAGSIAPRSRFHGVMLAYTPLHFLLIEEARAPLVMTSGNVTDEPIATGNEEALSRLAGIADFFLVHDREIHIRTDDSVARVSGADTRLLRRSRGYVPRPVGLPIRVTEPVLAVGAELKNAIALARAGASDPSRGEAFLSHHIGDLKTPAAFGAFRQAISHLSRVLEIEPRIVACDLHPDYLSTRWAREESSLPAIEVQHHHAHAAACLAENGRAGPVLALTLDGVGLGPDGTIWGCELLVAEFAGARRLARLEHVRMPGGDAASAEPRRMAAAWASSIWGEDFERRVVRLFEFCTREEAAFWAEMARRGVNSPLASSAGRLFDAAACIAGLRGRNAYEGQAACELEGVADASERSAYPCRVEREGELFVIRGSDLLEALAEDVLRGSETGTVAARFHNGLAEGLLRSAELAREATGLRTVALSGGVFQNALLSERLSERLLRAGFEVLAHRLVPANDGGLALGQAAVAAARLLGGRA